MSLTIGELKTYLYNEPYYVLPVDYPIYNTIRNDVSFVSTMKYTIYAKDMLKSINEMKIPDNIIIYFDGELAIDIDIDDDAKMLFFVVS